MSHDHSLNRPNIKTVLCVRACAYARTCMCLHSAVVLSVEDRCHLLPATTLPVHAKTTCHNTVGNNRCHGLNMHGIPRYGVTFSIPQHTVKKTTRHEYPNDNNPNDKNSDNENPNDSVAANIKNSTAPALRQFHPNTTNTQTTRRANDRMDLPPRVGHKPGRATILHPSSNPRPTAIICPRTKTHAVGGMLLLFD